MSAGAVDGELKVDPTLFGHADDGDGLLNTAEYAFRDDTTLIKDEIKP